LWGHDIDGRILIGPIGFLGKEAAVDCARRLGSSIRVRLGGTGEDVVPHFFAELLHVPTEGLRTEICHAISIFVRHFKMDDGIHRYSST